MTGVQIHWEGSRALVPTELRGYGAMRKFYPPTVRVQVDRTFLDSSTGSVTTLRSAVTPVNSGAACCATQVTAPYPVKWCTNGYGWAARGRSAVSWIATDGVTRHTSSATLWTDHRFVSAYSSCAP